MTAEQIILTNVVRLMVIAFLLLSITKIILLSRESSWDGWSLMSISLTLLLASVLLNLFKQFGISLENLREVLAALSGILAAAAFIISTVTVKRAAGKK